MNIKEAKEVINEYIPGFSEELTDNECLLLAKNFTNIADNEIKAQKYDELTKEGSFLWAQKMMMEGKSVKTTRGNQTIIIAGNIENTIELMEKEGFSFSLAQINATDWEIHNE